jgi:hypothetical protein
LLASSIALSSSSSSSWSAFSSSLNPNADLSQLAFWGFPPRSDKVERERNKRQCSLVQLLCCFFSCFSVSFLITQFPPCTLGKLIV